MEKQEILDLVKDNRANMTGVARMISHPRNPATRYYALQTTLMHCDDGEWRDAVIYTDLNTAQCYCRRADDFAKFVEVV